MPGVPVAVVQQGGVLLADPHVGQAHLLQGGHVQVQHSPGLPVLPAPRPGLCDHLLGEALGHGLGEEGGEVVHQEFPLAVEDGGDDPLDRGEWQVDVGLDQRGEGDHPEVDLRLGHDCRPGDGEVVVDPGPVLTHDATLKGRLPRTLMSGGSAVQSLSRLWGKMLAMLK